MGRFSLNNESKQFKMKKAVFLVMNGTPTQPEFIKESFDQ
jgi:hypothetical protein